MEIEAYEKDIIKCTKAVGTYHVSHMTVIRVLARILKDYENACRAFEANGSEIVTWHTNKLGERNLVKNPLYLAIEKMRDDILAYSRELGITPTGLKRIKADFKEPQKSKLAEVMASYGKQS